MIDGYVVGVEFRKFSELLHVGSFGSAKSGGTAVDLISRADIADLPYPIVTVVVGEPRLLEIKTTCGNERTPFWMTSRECDVAAEQGSVYRIRRVFHFRNQVKMFDIARPLGSALRLTPATFMATPR